MFQVPRKALGERPLGRMRGHHEYSGIQILPRIGGFLAAVLARVRACDKQKDRSHSQACGGTMSLPNLSVLRQQLREHGAIYVPSALDDNSMRLARDAYQWSLCHPSRNSAQFQGTLQSP